MQQIISKNRTMKNIKALLITVLTIFLIGCSSSEMKHDASGIFEATEVVVSAQASGELMKFEIEEGSELSENQVVGYIDTIQLSLKKSQLLSSMKAVESRHSDVATQIAATKQQIETQKREKIRFEKLVTSDAANQKQVDDINAQILLLERQLTAQKENLEKGNMGVLGEKSSLLAQVAQLEDQIKKSVIYSPIYGTVMAKYAQPRELASQGRSLFKIADVKNMKLRAYITADQLNLLKIGQAVKVFADQGVDSYKQYDGTVVWIADKAEFTPKTIQTRDERANLVYAIKIAVENDGLIKKGMYGEVKFN